MARRSFILADREKAMVGGEKEEEGRVRNDAGIWQTYAYRITVRYHVLRSRNESFFDIGTSLMPHHSTEFSFTVYWS